MTINASSAIALSALFLSYSLQSAPAQAQETYAPAADTTPNSVEKTSGTTVNDPSNAATPDNVGSKDLPSTDGLPVPDGDSAQTPPRRRLRRVISRPAEQTSTAPNGYGDIDGSYYIVLPSADGAVQTKQPYYDPSEVKSSGPLPLLMVLAQSTGGRRAKPHEVPWQAQIYQPWSEAYFAEKGDKTDRRPLWQRQHLCGGALIDKEWILTAAHCLADDDSHVGYRVRLGTADISSGGGWTYEIDRVVRHPNYQAFPKGLAKGNDIALVHFKPIPKSLPSKFQPEALNQGPWPRSAVAPIALDRPSSRSYPLAYATGWGATNTTEGDVAPVMIKVRLDLLDNQTCTKREGTTISDSELCAATPNRQTCKGDSGGPLVNAKGSPRVIGVVSRNNTRCIGDVNTPGIYTRVANYSEWIHDVIHGPAASGKPAAAGPRP